VASRWYSKNILNKRSYSTFSNSSNSIQLSTSLPVPLQTFYNLDNDSLVLSYRKTLRNKSGVYCIINTINGKLYVGSAKDLYLRLAEHILNRKSNIALQNAILKYGLKIFNFAVLEYFVYDAPRANNKALTDLETSYIKKYSFDSLYNFKQTAISMLGYKHTNQAKLKMLTRFEDKSNHPMFFA
jgi:excinuclease UvrABC nuclease subunit